MGLNPQRVYFDSCVVIYSVEEHPTVAPLVEARLASQVSVANVIIQVSDLRDGMFSNASQERESAPPRQVS
jgi:hypothetical protein